MSTKGPTRVAGQPPSADISTLKDAARAAAPSTNQASDTTLQASAKRSAHSAASASPAPAPITSSNGGARTQQQRDEEQQPEPAQGDRGRRRGDRTRVDAIARDSQQRHPGREHASRRHVSRGDRLFEHTAADDDERDDPERERRLDDRQRREPQRADLERCARRREPDAGQPAPAAEQRREDPVGAGDRRDGARLQRLQQVRALEAQCRHHGEGQPGWQSVRHACLPDRAAPSAGRRPRSRPCGRRWPTRSAWPAAGPASDRVLLTFDDGPHPEGTPAVLDRLDDAGAKATFFLVGEQVERDPGLAREIANADTASGSTATGTATSCASRRGRCARTSTERKPPSPRQPEVVATDYRPPYGILSLGAVAEARRRGWSMMLWSHWGRDWRRRATAASIAALVLRDLGAGDIVLLHDSDAYSAAGSWRATVGALDLLLPDLAERGLL